jgi:hypothetical protein
MDLDANSLLASMVVSGVGFVFLSYGKKQGRLPQMVAGLVLMIFPYFVSNVALMGGIATGVVLLVWLAIRAGA